MASVIGRTDRRGLVEIAMRVRSRIRTIVVAALPVMAPALLALAQEPGSGEALKAEPAEVVLTRLDSVFTEPVAEPNHPDAVPARVMTRTVLAINLGSSAAEMDSTVMTESIPPGAVLIVTDIDAPGAGPIQFRHGSPSSGLTYEFLGLGNSVDDLMFSDDAGATFTYTPQLGWAGTDPNVTHLRIHPKGAFAGRNGAGLPSFQLKYRLQIRQPE